MNITIFRKILQTRASNIQFLPNIRACSTEKTEPEIPVNLIKNQYSADSQTGNGHIYDKKPFKYHLKGGKKYSWCLCGRSKSQPFCDGTHKNIFWKITLKPIQFMVKESKEYWLCNCKQTKNRPFCDGTHLRADIQEKRV